jgi:hypothetical protein
VHVWQLVRNVLLLLACSHAILSLQQAVVHSSPFLTRFPFLTSAVTPAPAYQKERVEKESKAQKSSCPLPHAVGGRGVRSADGTPDRTVETGGEEEGPGACGAHLNPEQGEHRANQAQAPLRSSGGAAEQVAGTEMEQAIVSENQQASVQDTELARATEARDKMEQRRDVAMLYPSLARGGTLAQSLHAFILQLQSTGLAPL